MPATQKVVSRPRKTRPDTEVPAALQPLVTHGFTRRAAKERDLDGLCILLRNGILAHAEAMPGGGATLSVLSEWGDGKLDPALKLRFESASELASAVSALHRER